MFDPYHKWLGIPKKFRPPTYYRLLGLEPDESDREVIEESAIRQSAHLRTYQIGEHADLCTRLLNEISQARTALLDPAKRKKYDAQLAQKSAARSPSLPAGPRSSIATGGPSKPASEIASIAASPSVFADLNSDPIKPLPKPIRREKKPPYLLLGVIAGASVLLLIIAVPTVLVGVLLFSRGSVDSNGRNKDNPIAFQKPEPKPIPGVKQNPPIKQNPPVKQNPPIKQNPPVKQNPPDVKPDPVTGLIRLREIYNLSRRRPSGVVDVLFLPDNSQLFLSGDALEKYSKDAARRLKVYSDEIIPGITGHTFLQLSEDGKTLFSVRHGEKTIRSWDVVSDKELGGFEGHQAIRGFDLLPGGKQLVSLGPDTLRLWDVQTRMEIFRSPPRPGYSNLDLGPDGTKAWITSSIPLMPTVLEIWDLQKKQRWRRLNLPVEGTVHGITIARNGIFALAFIKRTRPPQYGIMFGDLNAKQVEFKRTKHRINGVDFSPNGKYLAVSGADKTFYVWDAEKHKPLFECAGHSKRTVYRARFAPDGQHVYSCGDDGCMKIWKLPVPTEVVDKAKLPAPALVVSSVRPGLNSNDELYVSLKISNWASYREELFRITPDLPLAGKNNPTRLVEYLHNEDGELISGPRTIKETRNLRRATTLLSKRRINGKRLYVRLVDRRTGSSSQSNLVAIPMPKPMVVKSDPFPLLPRRSFSAKSLYCIRALPNSPFVVIAGGRVNLCDLRLGKIQPIGPSKSGSVNAALDVSSNSSLVAASIMGESSISLWTYQKKTGIRPAGVLVGHTDKVTRLVFLPDGRKLLSAGMDNSVRLWDAYKRKGLYRFDGHTNSVTGIAVSPDGKRAVSCSGDGEIRVWDLEKLKLIRSGRVTIFSPRVLGFAQGGKRIICGGSVGLALLDPENLRITHDVRVNRGAQNLSISPDGKLAVTCSLSATTHVARVWNTGNLQELYHLSHAGRARDAVFADNRTLVSGDLRDVYGWQLPKTIVHYKAAKHLLKQLKGTLTQQNRQVYPVTLSAGKTYCFEMKSNTIDSFLRLKTDQNRELATDDDSGEGLNSCLIYVPHESAVFYLHATALGKKAGEFELLIHEMSYSKIEKK